MQRLKLNPHRPTDKIKKCLIREPLPPVVDTVVNESAYTENVVHVLSDSESDDAATAKMGCEHEYLFDL